MQIYDKKSIGNDLFVKKSGNADKAKRAEDSDDATAAANESVDISSKARELGRIKKMLESVPDVRGEMVVKLKNDIQEGNYKVETGKVAEKMIERALKNGLNIKA